MRHERLLTAPAQPTSKIILTQKHLLAGWPVSAAKLIALDSTWDQISTRNDRNLSSVMDQRISLTLSTPLVRRDNRRVSVSHTAM